MLMDDLNNQAIDYLTFSACIKSSVKTRIRQYQFHWQYDIRI